MKAIYIMFVGLLALLFNACSSDDDAVIQPKADFDYTIEEGTVHFTNKSVSADVYAWEFGDINNSVSTEINPSHTYLRAGTYDVEVTLYAGDGSTGVNDNITKVISLVDVPPSIIIDGDFDDWKDVPYVEDLVVEGSILKVKVDGSGDYINIFVEGTNDLNFGIPSIYIDIDNSHETGYINSDWYGQSGFEVLGENLGGFHNFTGESGTNQWSWGWVADSGTWLIISEIVGITEDKKGIEMSLPKAQLNLLTNNGLSSEGVNVVLKDVTAGWQTVGQCPPIWQNALPISIKF